MDALIAAMRALGMPPDLIRHIQELSKFLSETQVLIVASLIANAFVRGRLIEVDKRLRSLEGQDHAVHH